MTVQISTRTLNQVALDGFDEAARLVVRDAQSTARRTARSDTGAYRDSFVGAKCGEGVWGFGSTCLLYTSPSPRDQRGSRMPSSA